MKIDKIALNKLMADIEEAIVQVRKVWVGCTDYEYMDRINILRTEHALRIAKDYVEAEQL